MKPVGQLMVKMCAEEEFVWPWLDRELEVEDAEVLTQAWGVISAENEVISVAIVPTPNMATNDLQVQGSAADPEVAVDDLDEADLVTEDTGADPGEEDTNTNIDMEDYESLFRFVLLISIQVFVEVLLKHN